MKRKILALLAALMALTMLGGSALATFEQAADNLFDQLFFIYYADDEDNTIAETYGVVAETGTLLTSGVVMETALDKGATLMDFKHYNTEDYYDFESYEMNAGNKGSLITIIDLDVAPAAIARSFGGGQALGVDTSLSVNVFDLTGMGDGRYQVTSGEFDEGSPVYVESGELLGIAVTGTEVWSFDALAAPYRGTSAAYSGGIGKVIEEEEEDSAVSGSDYDDVAVTESVEMEVNTQAVTILLIVAGAGALLVVVAVVVVVIVVSKKKKKAPLVTPAPVIIKADPKPAPQPTPVAPRPAPVAPVVPQPVPAAPVVPRPAQGSMYIRCVAGALSGAIFKVDRKLLIGRDVKLCAVTYPADEAGISRQHCTVEPVDAMTIGLRDAGSQYGTFVGGRRLTADDAVALQEGDRFTLVDDRNVFMVFRMED